MFTFKNYNDIIFINDENNMFNNIKMTDLLNINNYTINLSIGLKYILSNFINNKYKLTLKNYYILYNNTIYDKLLVITPFEYMQILNNKTYDNLIIFDNMGTCVYNIKNIDISNIFDDNIKMFLFNTNYEMIDMYSYLNYIYNNNKMVKDKLNLFQYIFFHIYNFKILYVFPTSISDITWINIFNLPKNDIEPNTEFNIKYSKYINNMIKEYNNEEEFKKKYLKYKEKYIILKQLKQLK